MLTEVTQGVNGGTMIQKRYNSVAYVSSTTANEF